MRIVYDAQIFRQQRYGGISRYFCEVAQRIRGNGDRAHVLAPSHMNAYLPAARPGTVIGWRSPQPRGTVVQRAASKVTERLALALLRPDVVHETYFWGPILDSGRALRVLTIYDMIHERFPANFSTGDRTSERKRQAAARADHIICISEATRRDVMELLGVDAGKLTVTHLAASFAGAGSAAFATEAPSPTGRPYVLYVGDRGGYKNFARVVQALGASAVLKDHRLVCYGGGPLTAAELADAQAAGLAPARLVHRHGDDAQLAALYAGAACFVYPSLYEGFGIPPLEAMQCGCPVVCSNASSIPEVAGDAARYFDPADSSALREAVEQVALSPGVQADLRRRGTAQAARFSWDRCAAETLAVYRRLT